MSNSTHISNFGKFQSNLRQYADIDGYLPLEGCGPWELKHDHAFQDNDPEYRTWWEEDRWPEIVQAVKEAIQEANEAIEEWQSEPISL